MSLSPTTLYKYVAETRNYVMDFTSILLNGIIITNINSVTKVVSSGAPDISMNVSAGSIIANGTKIGIAVTGGLAGNTYNITILVTTSDAQILAGIGQLVVQ